MSDAAVVELLITNGLHGANSRQALRQFEMQRTNPAFVASLANIFGSFEAPFELPPVAQQYPWGVVRQVAGWVLKTVVQQGITAEAMGSAATAGLSVLQEESTDRRLVSAAAVIIARLTAIGGVEWWMANNFNLSGLLLEEMLPSESPARVTAALLCLQYLVEDAASHLGAATESIIVSVADVAINHADAHVRGIALSVLAAIYEFGFDLDWRVENFSPLQIGLTEGSARTASAISTALSQWSTLEPEVAAKVFRTGAYLVEYLKYLEVHPEVNQGLLTMFSVWAQAVLDATSPNGTATEVANQALGFVSAAYNSWEKEGGQGSIADLCTAFSNKLEALLDNILFHMIMKDEEEHEVLATDAYDHRDRHVRRRAGKRKHDEEKAGDDELCPEASVRNAACIAIEFIAFVEPERVAPHIVSRAGAMLQDPDWHQAECAICALGSIFSGCQNDLIPSLPSLIPMIGEAVGTGQPGEGNHVATMSICIFTLMKFSSWAIAHDDYLFDATVTCILPCLTSLSKRVQNAAITFVDRTLEQALVLDPQGAGPLQKHLSVLMDNVYSCLPVYHTNNLHMLCMTVSRLLSIMGGPDHIGPVLQTFEGELQNRLPRLQQTMHRRYMEENEQESVDCDAFELGFTVAMAHATMAISGDVTEQVMASITTWVEVLKFACQCECGDDDAGIFHSPLSIISQMINLVNPDTFASYLSGTSFELVNLVLHIAATVADTATRSSSLSIIYSLVECYGVNAIPSLDEVLHTMLKFPTATEDCGVAADCALLMSKLFEVVNPPPDHFLRYAAALASQVRGDTVDNKAMILMAESIGCIMHLYPQNFTLAQATEVALALHRGSNNEFKGASTQAVAAIIMGYAESSNCGAEELDWCFCGFIKLVCSWQSDARHFQGVTDCIGSTLSYAQQHPVLGAALQREVYNRLPQPMIQMLSATYGI